MTKILRKILATKELKEYIDAAKNNFEIDLNYSLGQQITEFFDSNRESFFSMHRNKVSNFYTANSLPQNKLNNGLDTVEKKEVHL